MILQALKNMYPKASEKVLRAVMKDLEKFHDCWSEYASLAEEAIFAYAFKLGGRLMLETLQEKESR